jgi:exodeoxyribonuclease VII small subunit
MSTRSTPGEPAKEPSFEEALARLEAIVQELEGTDLSLEETLARYEEGSRLVKSCARRLEEAEQRIRQLAGSGETPGSSAVREPAAGEEAGEEAEDDGSGGLPF